MKEIRIKSLKFLNSASENAAKSSEGAAKHPRSCR
jgi:hypothetical protein